MHIDDLVSSLKFLNRRQLLYFYSANRFTLNIVENHFAEWPAIYCELAILLKGKKDIEGISEERANDGNLPHISPLIDPYIELKALKCDCEQQLSIKINELLTYKLMVKCQCNQKLWLPIDENEREYFEYNMHENCKEDWHPLENPISDIPYFRRTSDGMRFLYDKYSSHFESPDKCCQFFAHSVHDQRSCNSIVKEFIFTHRRHMKNPKGPELNCPKSLLLQTRDLNKLFTHLKMNFVKIYKLRLEFTNNNYFYSEGNEQKKCQIDYDNEETMCLKILQWLLENGKISNAISCIVDVDLLEEKLKNLMENEDGMIQQQILINSLAKCGHLQLISRKNFDDGTSWEEAGNYWENLFVLSGLQQMLLKNTLMITTGHGLNFRDFRTIENFLQSYNPQMDHRRLVIIEGKTIFNIADQMIKAFLTSNAANTYFLLIFDYIVKEKKFEQKYYNAATNEYLRIMPAYRYSISEPMDLVPVYLTRYSKLSTIADKEFESFFERVNQNVARRIKLCEQEIVRRNMDTNEYGSWMITLGNLRIFGPEDDDKLICSFSAYLSNVFPEFSLNICGQRQHKNDAEEIYNSENTILFGRKLLPP